MKISEEIKTNFKDDRHMALVNLMFTANWFRDLNKDILKEYNLLPQHYNVLRIVKGKSPDPSCPGDIKKVMLDKGPDVTRLIDKLVKMGYIERCLNEMNRRSMDIKLTEEGAEILEDMSRKMDKVFEENFHLSEKDALHLSNLLDQSRSQE
ncbi:MarR family winged helix-turn-helix transcriptional regulator [Reichenbachiella ulvae]|uniref:MarR family transcriptional regulator n=1 Tax=Reichenbachiella ulvae TaxID=2980104 RepID=A0ABT3CXM6_9BACT|nr:winged helix DNA-binding protein [Reichenbachiella ulvae]MCV9388451.1 MarR family transcriptional regulator [Reichenbachiella ulvae]